MPALPSTILLTYAEISNFSSVSLSLPSSSSSCPAMISYAQSFPRSAQPNASLILFAELCIFVFRCVLASSWQRSTLLFLLPFFVLIDAAYSFKSPVTKMRTACDFVASENKRLISNEERQEEPCGTVLVKSPRSRYKHWVAHCEPTPSRLFHSLFHQRYKNDPPAGSLFVFALLRK